MEPGAEIVAFSGQLVLGGAGHGVERILSRLIAGTSRHVIFDLAGLTDIDCAGVGLIAHWAGELKRRGGMVSIASAKGMVRKVLAVVHLDAPVRFFATTEEACERFRLSDHAVA